MSLFTPGCGVRDMVAVAGWRNVLPSSPGPMARVRGPRVNMSAQSHRTPTLPAQLRDILPGYYWHAVFHVQLENRDSNSARRLLMQDAISCHGHELVLDNHCHRVAE